MYNINQPTKNQSISSWGDQKMHMDVNLVFPRAHLHTTFVSFFSKFTSRGEKALPSIHQSSSASMWWIQGSEAATDRRIDSGCSVELEGGRRSGWEFS